jgi:hypothetical protein
MHQIFLIGYDLDYRASLVLTEANFYVTGCVSKN